MNKLKDQRHRESTQENYYSIWKNFNKFFLRLDVKPKSWEERLTLFVGHLIQNKRKSTTIKCYISAIKAVLSKARIKLKLDTALLTALTQACKLKYDTVQSRLPITKPILHLILRSVPKLFKSQQPYLTALYRALFCTAYYGLFRSGEVTKSPHVVKAKDVYIADNKPKFMFVLHSSKTHGKGNKPQIIKIKG